MNREKHEMATKCDAGQILQINAARRYLHEKKTEIETREKQALEKALRRELFDVCLIVACAILVMIGITFIDYKKQQNELKKIVAVERRILE